MLIDFDTVKDDANRLKHGVSLSLAAELEWDTLQSMADTRRNYGEARMVGYVIAGSRLYCVVYVDRNPVRRIISLRKANTREVIRYVENS